MKKRLRVCLSDGMRDAHVRTEGMNDVDKVVVVS